MSDAKKISRRLADKYAGITDIVEKKPEPKPARSSSLWDDYTPTSRPRYVRDRWAKSDTPKTSYPEPTYGKFPLSESSKFIPSRGRNRPPYTSDDVDWELAQTVKIDRSVTWTHWLQLLGLESLYPDLDGEVFNRVRNIFIVRKQRLFTE